MQGHQHVRVGTEDAEPRLAQRHDGVVVPPVAFGTAMITATDRAVIILAALRPLLQARGLVTSRIAEAAILAH